MRRTFTSTFKTTHYFDYSLTLHPTTLISPTSVNVQLTVQNFPDLFIYLFIFIKTERKKYCKGGVKNNLATLTFEGNRKRNV